MLLHASIDDAPLAPFDDEVAPAIMARHLAAAVGRCDLEQDLDRLEAIRPALVEVIGHLVIASGRAWVIHPDEPMVAIVRMLGRLAVESPDTAVADGDGTLRSLVDGVAMS